jgi:toxin CcdB
MAQFDVYEIAGQGLVVDCQHAFASDLRSRIVAPLRDADEPIVSAPRLNPLVTIGGARYRIATQYLRAVDRNQLGPCLGSVTAHESEIKAAIDLLLSGF